MVERITGSPKDKFLKVCEWIAATADARQGDDHHVRARAGRSTRRARRTSARMAMIQLLLGNIGVPAAA